MDEQMYESRDACPWYQSTDLDFDAARAEWERDRQAAAYADYCATMAERCDVCDRDGATRCEHGTLTLCVRCADTDEHREYCATEGGRR